MAEKTVDWKSIEFDYRAGVKSLRAIAHEHGLTHGAINKRAKRDSWERDLAPKIKARADTLVSRLAVSKEVSAEQKVSERQVVEANAEMRKDVIISHRTDIGRNRRLANALMDELEAMTGNAELFAKLGGIFAAPDESGAIDKLSEAFKKVTSHPGRVDSFKKLVESIKTLVGLERTAFGIDERSEGTDTAKAITQAILAMS